MTQTLESRAFITLEVQVGAPLDLGIINGGARRCVPLLGGRFYGDIEGEVLAGGTDWQLGLSDDTLDIAAHYALRTSDGALIEVSSNGLRRASKEVRERIANGQYVPGSEYYFRTAIRMRTAAPALQRLNSMLAISVGQRMRDGVKLAVFELL